MNTMDLVDLKAFNEESLLFEIVSSQENSAYNSFANDEMDYIPTEFERNYFEELSRVLGEEMDDNEILLMQQEMKDDHQQQHQEMLEENPFHVNIIEWSMIDSLNLCPMEITNTQQEKIPNSLFSVPNLIDEKIENETKDKVSLKWRTQPCAYFQANGFCKKGDKCNFSHEIPHQSNKPFVPADQLYRTKPCHFFFTTGVCRKGENCNFSHDPSIFEKAGGTTSPNQDD